MKLNILLVDDNQAVRKMIRNQLLNWDYNLDEASNGLEALEKLIQMAGSENRPNIAVPLSVSPSSIWTRVPSPVKSRSTSIVTPCR